MQKNLRKYLSPFEIKTDSWNNAPDRLTVIYAQHFNLAIETDYNS